MNYGPWLTNLSENKLPRLGAGASSLECVKKIEIRLTASLLTLLRQVFIAASESRMHMEMKFACREIESARSLLCRLSTYDEAVPS